MKALTIRQPHAQLIALEVKRYETRSWPTKYRGPLLIHAGKKKPRAGFVGEYRIDGGGMARPSGCRTCRDPRWPLPLGAVVAVCDLVDCLPMHEFSRDAEPGGFVHCYNSIAGPTLWRSTKFDDGSVADGASITDQLPYGGWSEGRWAWALDNVRVLDKPVPCRGQQRLWTPGEETINQINKQL